MNQLEKSIMEKLEETGDADDIISKSLRNKHTDEKQQEENTNMTTKLFGLAVAASISYGTYLLCIELLQTKYGPLSIPTAIWGLCGASYTYRKINNR